MSTENTTDTLVATLDNATVEELDGSPIATENKPVAPTLLKSEDAFKKSLTTFVATGKTNMKAALDCTNYAINHFASCGDMGPLQRFYDAMTKNYHRRSAFKFWVTMHSPITMEKDKFAKDRNPKAIKMNLEGAFKKAFWDCKPDREDTWFVSTDVVDALQKTVKKFEGDKYHTLDKSAAELIKQTKNFFDNLLQVKTTLNIPQEVLIRDGETVENTTSI